jgi:hypothetical protein
MPADVHVGSFERVNEVERDLSTGLVEVIFEGLIDVAVGLLTRDDRLVDHRRAPDARALRTRLRSLLK